MRALEGYWVRKLICALTHKYIQSEVTFAETDGLFCVSLPDSLCVGLSTDYPSKSRDQHETGNRAYGVHNSERSVRFVALKCDDFISS